MVSNPLLARPGLLRGRNQQRPNTFTIFQSDQYIGLTPPGNHRGGTRTRRPFGSQNFSDHAAAPNAGARAAGHGFQRRIARTALLNQLRRRVLAWVGAEQAGLVGQDDQSVCLDQIGHQRAQGVVVAELDFVVDDCVVLIDDGDHAQPDQSEQRGAGIEVAFPVGQIRMGEQHLGAAQTVFPQFGLVHLRQAHLPDRSCGL